MGGLLIVEYDCNDLSMHSEEWVHLAYVSDVEGENAFDCLFMFAEPISNSAVTSCNVKYWQGLLLLHDLVGMCTVHLLLVAPSSDVQLGRKRAETP